MALTHAGFAFPGVDQDPQISEWNRQEELLQVFGLLGAAVLPGGFTIREVRVPVLLYNSWTQAAAHTYWQSLDRRSGTIGNLVWTGSVVATIPYVEFLRFQFDRLLPPNAHLGWALIGELHFRQLRPAA